jgi:Ca-activated chloride channel family protein
MGSLDFRFPWFLAAAFAAIPVYWWATHGSGRVVFSSFRLLPRRGRSWRVQLAWVPGVLLALSVISLAFGAAGPRRERFDKKVEREGIAIMMVVDVSGSMRALDLDPERQKTRLDVVKKVFEDFVVGHNGLKGRDNDAIGMVSFARYADSRAPLTLDHDSLVTLVRSLKLVSDRSQENATAIGDGLALAVERLRQVKNAGKVAILLTDGVNNAGEETPLGAAELAAAKDIKVYTIGAGTRGRAPIRVPNPFGPGYRLASMPVQIDEATLKAVAAKTGGKYFRADNGDALRQIYGEIDRLETTKFTESHLRDWVDYYPWCIGIGLILAALAWLARGTIFRRHPC